MRVRKVGRIGAVVVAILTTIAIAKPAGAAPSGAADEAIDYHEWSGASAFATGTNEGVQVDEDGLRVGEPIGTMDRTEPDLGTTRTYEYGRWTSPSYQPGFGANELVSSWNAATPADTWVQVEAKGQSASGQHTDWYVLGQWAHGDGDIQRTSVDGQDDANAQVNVDTLATKPGVTLTSYQLRVSLYREAGSTATPTVRSLGAMTSNVPDRFEVPITPPDQASGIELPVPRHAQNLHEGKFPEYGGGGENWCSPTSTEMVVEFWGKGPSEREMSWIPRDYVDPTVAQAARYTYDYAYEGTGNWPFNTAYVGHYGLRGHITRLHSLADVEDYIARGIPVITSHSFRADELDGAGYGTAGHIMVVVGFTPNGDVIANDPAASTNERVRNVYPRAQFETIWQRTQRYDPEGQVASGTGGIAYIITP